MTTQTQNPQSPTASSTSPLQRSSPKIAILHDAFLYRGGGERLVTLMAKSLDADLVAGFFSEGSFDPRELGFEGRIIPLGKPVFATGIRHMILKWRFFWKARILREYDIVIFSGDCLGAMRHVRDDAKKIYYCHTPPRYLYDFRSRYLDRLSVFLRPIFRMAFVFFAGVYESHLRDFDQIFTNSKNVQNRLKKFTGYDSEIVYPPTDTSYFIPEGRGKREGTRARGEENHRFENYYLSWARLSPPKRVEWIIDAFLRMPDKNLIFTYGKNDPLKDQILAKIAGAKNILAIESPDDHELLRLISGAVATIYIPIDEDFGMTSVESMACGIPVIGVREGGLLETILDGETGRLLELKDHATGVEAIMKTIQDTPIDIWRGMRDASIERATHFSLDSFQKKLKSLIQL